MCSTSGWRCCRHCDWKRGDKNKNNNDDYSTRNSGSTPLGVVQPVVTNPVNLLLSAQQCQVSNKASPLLALSCLLFFFSTPSRPHNRCHVMSSLLAAQCFLLTKRGKQKQNSSATAVMGNGMKDKMIWMCDFSNLMWVIVSVQFKNKMHNLPLTHPLWHSKLINSIWALLGACASQRLQSNLELSLCLIASIYSYCCTKELFFFYRVTCANRPRWVNALSANKCSGLTYLCLMLIYAASSSCDKVRQWGQVSITPWVQGWCIWPVHVRTCV